jgi:hypothetical protein
LRLLQTRYACRQTALCSSSQKSAFTELTSARTHKPNILDAFGKDWFDVREGEASVFKHCKRLRCTGRPTRCRRFRYSMTSSAVASMVGLSRLRRGDIASCRYRNNSFCDEFGRKSGQRLIVAPRPTFFDARVATIDKAGLRQALTKRIRVETICVWGCAVQETDQRRACGLRWSDRLLRMPRSPTRSS